MRALDQPPPFLQVRIHQVTPSPGLTGLCVGYENSKWRCEALVKHAFEWLPEFALTDAEARGLGSANCVDRLREAAAKVYKSDKFANRGEFGELFLHVAIRQVFHSVPAISKIYYKSSRNDTVKGFDAVHVVPIADGFELWLGEAKFYNDANRAVRDIVAEIVAHTGIDYLRDEFILISGKLDESADYAAPLRTLLSRNTSIDDVFKRVCIPAFITYDSDCIAEYDAVSTEYEAAFAAELAAIHETFANSTLPSNIQIHLFLMPLESKADLVASLHKQLKVWQQI